MHILTSPAFYLVAVPAVLLTGISKGGFAGALGVLAVPLLALAVPVPQAASIMLPILCMMDLFGWWNFRKSWDGPLILAMLPGTLLGLGLGWLLFTRLDNRMIVLVTGALAAGFAVIRLVSSSNGGRALLPDRLRAWLWTTLSGCTTLLAHAGGPPVLVYVAPKGLDKTTLVATLTFYFALVNYLKLIPFGLMGQLDGRNLGTALVLSPLVPLGVYLGLWLHRRVNERLFFRLFYLLLLATGIQLIWEGIR